MLKHLTALALLLTLPLLVACAPASSEPLVRPAAGEGPPATTDAAATGQEMGMGRGNGMGRGSSMRVAHHATIPDAYATLTNQIEADEDSLSRGADLFSTHCAVCHGDGGMGDGPGGVNLDPQPAAIAHTSQMMSDAYLFWRISEGGRGDPLVSAMPSWKDTLDEQSRWDVINYVQALGQGTVQPRSYMGGDAIDPEYERRHRTDMLASAMTSDVISQAEADTFSSVHEALDALMVETGLRMQGSNLPALLSILISRGTVTQVQADEFTAIHDRLIEAGLMQ